MAGPQASGNLWRLQKKRHSFEKLPAEWAHLRPQLQVRLVLVTRSFATVGSRSYSQLWRSRKTAFFTSSTAPTASTRCSVAFSCKGQLRNVPRVTTLEMRKRC